VGWKGGEGGGEVMAVEVAVAVAAMVMVMVVAAAVAVTGGAKATGAHQLWQRACPWSS
jgi:hypothetical protein